LEEALLKVNFVNVARLENVRSTVLAALPKEKKIMKCALAMELVIAKRAVFGTRTKNRAKSAR
jgi:hypothetical protein